MPPTGDKLGRTCPYCGAVVTSEDFFCRACHKRFELQGAETDPTKLAALPEGSVLSLRNPVLAAILSFTGMGFGQFYNGDTVKGLVFNAAYLPVVFGYLSLPSPWILAGVWGISLIDAPVASWRINRLAKEYAGPSPLFYLELFVLAALFCWYLFSGDAFVWVKKLFPAVWIFTQ